MTAVRLSPRHAGALAAIAGPGTCGRDELARRMEAAGYPGVPPARAASLAVVLRQTGLVRFAGAGADARYEATDAGREWLAGHPEAGQ